MKHPTHIYQARAGGDNFQGLGSDGPIDHDLIYQLLITPKSVENTWPKPKVRMYSAVAKNPLLKQPGGLYGLQSDVPSFGSKNLVLSTRAMDVLRPFVEKYGELLPLEVRHDSSYYSDFGIFHVTNQLDALDFDRSEIEYWEDGSIDEIHQFAFKEEVIRGSDVFRIPTRYPQLIFVSQAFVDCAQQANLTGLKCWPMWSSDKPQTRQAIDAKRRRTDPAPKRTVPTITRRDLTAAERATIQDHARNGLRLVSSGRRSITLLPESIQEEIYETLHRLRQTKSRLPDAQLAHDIGCLWGESVREITDWEWVMGDLEGKQFAPAMVNPKRSHIIFPVAFIESQLSKSKADVTSMLVFNMIKEGNLPTAAPGDHLQLG